MRNWKRLILCVVVFLCGLLPLSGPAYGADKGSGGQRIGYVISQKILLESASGQDFLAEKKELEEKKKQRVKGEMETLKELRDEAETKQMFLNMDAKEKLEEEIKEKEKEISRLREDSLAEMKKFVKNTMRQMNEEASEIIMKIGEREKFDLILDVSSRASSIVYINPEFDITDRVIEMYNQDHKAKKSKKKTK